METKEITIPKELIQMIKSHTIAINELKRVLTHSYQNTVALEQYENDLNSLLEIRKFIVNLQS